MRGETFIGSPCRKCGGTTRYVSSRNCVPCHAARAKARYLRDPKASHDVVRRWRSNPENAERSRLWTKARDRAKARLVDAHRDEFERYIDVERALLGLPVRSAR